MKLRRSAALVCATALTFSIAATAQADDGFKVSKSMSHEGGSVDGGLAENEHAFVATMKFYTQTQRADGTVEPVEYYDVDDELVEERDLAKPLIGVYINGEVQEVTGEEILDEETGAEIGFAGHGLRDAWGAVSLDDGETWKNTNLSESAVESSSTVVREDVELFQADDLDTYPGDVTNIFHSVAGNTVLVAWQSRYCSQGQPSYSLDTEDPTAEQIARREAIATYLDIDLATASPDDLYLIDMFGVGGSQGSVDYAEDKWEQNWPVGEVPFNCLWTARGVLNDGDDPRTTDVAEESFMRWFNPERLTSGRRDVNRIEVQCLAGAGCAITWQEDPEGLLPGQGEGPGAGWSGAIANSQTDVWYSYLDWEDLTVVQDPADDVGATPMPLADYELAATDTTVTQKPKPFVPFAMPMRLTDNAKCNTTNPQPYCNGSAINASFPDLYVPMDYDLKDMCAATVEIPTGKSGVLTPVCVTEDGMPLVGNTAATRPRLALHGYASTGEVKDPVDGAFVVVVSEEDKGLGSFGFTVDGDTTCTPTKDNADTCIPFDEGKNIWYHSFSMSLTDGLALDERDGLLATLGHHGNMLNQPEVDWTTGEFSELRNTADMWDFGTYNYDLYNTEIARRGSLLTQDVVKALPPLAKEGLVALPTWKQGSMNQGGPADVMSRRIEMPKGWNLYNDDPAKSGNPYAFRNLECDNLAFADGSNPYYPDGLCLDPAINLSATVPDKCTDTAADAGVPCPTVDLSAGTTFGIGDTDPILQGTGVPGESNTMKVLSWHQCPADFTAVSSTDGTGTVTCESDDRTDDSTLADQSWYNPLDVAKGHRGFLDGDFVMMLYAWSPNWRLNADGNDRYELYIRRSFDGAETWTTLPKNFKATDNAVYGGEGTVTCETYRSEETEASGDLVEPRSCNAYEAGAAEQARNVTQHQSMRITTLDPRFATTGSPYGVSITADPFGVGVPGYTSGGDSEDVRDPSRYFVVYETGDNTTTEFGEPEPLDLFYSRAVMFGDHYQVWAEETDLSVCYPSDPHEDTDPDTGVPTELVGSGFCNEFDQLEQGTPGLEASEASLQANPGGEFLYAAWAQLGHDDAGEAVESDAMVRRVWWIDDYISDTLAWDFGQGQTDLLRSAGQ